MSVVEAAIRARPISWLRERDVDLLLCSETHAQGALFQFLLSSIERSGLKFKGCWVSHSDFDGESDLVLAVEDQGELTIALIENKISARFQEDQAARYNQRALRWQSEEGVSRVVSVLIAPRIYIESAAKHVFDHKIEYEELCDAICSEEDTRTRFLARTLRDGIEKAQQGYVMEPDFAVSSFWQETLGLAQEVAPGLNMKMASEKPTHSEWYYFPEAYGIETNDRRRLAIVYKATGGHADLQFSNTRAVDLAKKVAGQLPEGMGVVPAGKSASIRIKVPKVNVREPAGIQREAINIGLEACEALRVFFVNNRDALREP